MPVSKRDRLPDDHPISRGLIVFGAKRPKSLTKPSTTEGSSAGGQQLPDEDQIRLHNLNEKWLEEKIKEANMPFQKSESTSPQNTEKS